MRPIATLGEEEARALVGVLFDLDDTLLSHGALTEEAYASLFRLRRSGLTLVAVTGRPAAWGELLVRQWPLDGAVTENGAVALVREGRAVRVVDAVAAEERKARREKLAHLVTQIAAQWPDLTLADDASGRLTDTAWDIGERVSLPVERVDALARAVVDAGARVTRSSVHLHASFDADDKASGVVRFLRDRFAADAGAARFSYAYFGDSPNDASCFAAFRTTVGVANVRLAVPRLAVPPRYITTEPMGAGFAEAAAHIARLRGR